MAMQKRTEFLGLMAAVACVWGCPGAGCGELTAKGGKIAGRPLLVYNEDNEYYFYRTNDTAFTEKGLVDYVDSLCAGGAMTHYFMTVCGQRASYDSKAVEPIWLGLNEPNLQGRTNDPWCVNAKLLHDRGIDPFAVRLRRMRERGVSPWISMRMNDLHYVWMVQPNFRTESSFWKHPELKCRKDDIRSPWNYAEPAVQERKLAVVREILGRWDSDGIELDWMRTCWHLPERRYREFAHCITDFTRKVRREADAASKRRGHPVRICARIPTGPGAALAIGLDAEAWARENLVDWIIVCNCWDTVDFNMDFAAIRTRLLSLKPDLVVLPGFTDKFCAYPKAPLESMAADPAFMRGWAALYGGVADGLYMFNGFCHPQKVMDWFLSGGLSPDRVTTGARRFICTWHDLNVIAPCVTGADDEVQLPRPLSSGQSFRVRAAKAPQDRVARVRLGFDRTTAVPSVTLNGEAATDSSPVDRNGCFFPKEVALAVEWTFPVSALNEGVNRVTAAAVPGSSARIVWCEIAL